MSEDQSMIPTDQSRRRVLRWYESWILKVAGIVCLILFLGYGASIYIAIEGIGAISKIAYRQDLEESLSSHLDLLKETHGLRQEIATDRLKRFIPASIQISKSPKVTLPQVRRWVEKAKLTTLFTVDGIDVTEIDRRESKSQSEIEWLGPERLRVYQFTVDFPKGKTYGDFKTVESLRQAYQLFGETLRVEIQPAMAKSASIVLLITFLLLTSTFWFTMRRFKAKVEGIIDGFLYWSEIDDGFRFRGRWHGELRLITSQFNKMADEVAANRQRTLFLEKLASWQTIARKMAHEIKNPLTPIQMMISELTRRYRGEDKEFGTLLNNAQKIIGEEINGLRRMVESFSKFARLPEPKFEQTDVFGLLKGVRDLEAAAFPQHNIVFNPNGREMGAVLDEDQIRQVLLNLVKNAAEASGDTPVTIELIAIDRPNTTVLVVQDSGPGIPEKLQARIFEAYFTTKHTGPTPGMGLGLAICQKIVMDHGGVMTVASVPGDTRFEISLPKGVQIDRKSA